MIPSKQSEAPESLLSSFLSCMTRRCLTFTGRARRREYWGYFLFAVISGAILAGLLALAVQSGVVDPSDLSRPVGLIIIVLIGLLGLWLFIAGLAVTVRRFHDCNLPGWPAFVGALLILLPIPLFYTPLGATGGPGFFVLSMLLAACAIIGILGVAIIPGGKKKNKYGIAPKEI